MSQGGDIVGVPQLSQPLPASPTAGSMEDMVKQISAAAMAGSPTAGSMVALLKQLYTTAMAAGGTAGSLYETIRKLTAVAVPAMDDASVVYNSLFYRLMEIEKHIHGVEYQYGWNNATYANGTDIERHSTNPLELTAGDAAWGNELQIHGGSVLPGVRFDLNNLVVIEVGTANRPFVFQMFSGTKSAGVTCTFTNGTELVNKVAHGLSNGTKIMFNNSGGALPTGLSAMIVYYVVNKNDDDFQVSLTLGGAAVTFSDDGSGTNQYKVLTQSECFDCLISAAAVNADAHPYQVMMPRCLSTDFVWVRAKSAAGGNTVKYFIEGHGYPA